MIKLNVIYIKVYRVIKLNLNDLLKLYIEINPDLRKAAKADFEKLFFEADE